MPRFGVLVAVLGGALALIALTFALFPNGGGTPVSAAGETSDGAVTITVESSDGAVAWARLRWLVAGISIAAIVLVSARQLAVLAAPKGARAVVAQPQAPSAPSYEPAVSGWIPEGSQVSIGD